MAGQGFVDGVVDHLVHEVVQPGWTGRTDEHARSLTHWLEALEHGDGIGVVVADDGVARCVCAVRSCR